MEIITFKATNVINDIIGIIYFYLLSTCVPQYQACNAEHCHLMPHRNSRHPASYMGFGTRQTALRDDEVEMQGKQITNLVAKLIQPMATLPPPTPTLLSELHP